MNVPEVRATNNNNAAKHGNDFIATPGNPLIWAVGYTSSEVLLQRRSQRETEPSVFQGSNTLS